MRFVRFLLSGFVLLFSFLGAAQMPVVKDKPFTLKMKIVHTMHFEDGLIYTNTRWETTARDSSGKVVVIRESEPNCSQCMRNLNVTITDRNTKTTTQWDNFYAIVQRAPLTFDSDPKTPEFSENIERQRHTAQENGPKSETVSLGEKMLFGVTASGTRTTTIYPANSSGNNKEFSTVYESWFSRDLQAAMGGSTSDPRGSETREVVELTRGEPNPNLFQYPSNYQVRDFRF